MIALQARSPQLPDPAAQTAKFVNMMNMTKQQEAAERQAMQAQQAMEFARTGEARAVETQTATMREKNADFQDKELKRLGRIGVTVLRTEDPALREAAYQNLLGEVEKADPRLGATMRQVAPNFNAAVVESAVMEVDKYFGLKYPTPVASLELGVDGSPRSVTVGGLNPEQRPVYDAPEMPMAAPRATPTAPTNPMARNAPAPNAAGEAPGSLGLVVASALQTRVMSQADLDKMLANVQPASRPKIMNWVRENGISVADAPPLVDNQMRDTPMSYDGRTPQSQFAVMRGQPMQSQTAGLAGAPEMQQTLAQTQPRTITKLQQRNPNVSPYPGSAQVPIERVRAEGVAGRASPAETAANEAAKIGVQTKAKIAEEDRLKAKGRKLFSSVLNDLRNDYQKLNNMEAIPSIERGGFENVGDYIGASRVGRMAQSAVGARASVPLNTISNSKLTLMNALKEATGLSATQLSSNIELMTFLDSLADPTQGFESAMETIRRLDNLYGAPAATATAATAAPRAAAKTPVIPDAAKQMLRKNPSPQQRAFFDRTFGKGAAAKVMGNR
jgi:hypothetical protein